MACPHCIDAAPGTRWAAEEALQAGGIELDAAVRRLDDCSRACAPTDQRQVFVSRESPLTTRAAESGDGTDKYRDTRESQDRPSIFENIRARSGCLWSVVPTHGRAVPRGSRCEKCCGSMSLGSRHTASAAPPHAARVPRMQATQSAGMSTLQTQPQRAHRTTSAHGCRVGHELGPSSDNKSRSRLANAWRIICWGPARLSHATPARRETWDCLVYSASIDLLQQKVFRQWWQGAAAHLLVQQARRPPVRRGIRLQKITVHSTSVRQPIEGAELVVSIDHGAGAKHCQTLLQCSRTDVTDRCHGT